MTALCSGYTGQQGGASPGQNQQLGCRRRTLVTHLHFIRFMGSFCADCLKRDS